MRSMECDAVRVFQAISKIISCVPISSLLCWLNLAQFDATPWKVRFLSNFRSRLLVVLVPLLSAQQQPKLFLLSNSRNWWVWEFGKVFISWHLIGRNVETVGVPIKFGLWASQLGILAKVRVAGMKALHIRGHHGFFADCQVLPHQIQVQSPF